MMEQQKDVFYYVTMMNENYAQPSLPEGVEKDLLKGMYRHGDCKADKPVAAARLIGSGAILREIIAAAGKLVQDWNIDVEIWSATSFSELARDAIETERWNRLHPLDEQRTSHVKNCLGGHMPVIAATDYVRAWPNLIAPYIDAPYTVLGTDGFGRSDTRSALRGFFEVDQHHIVLATLHTLAGQGKIDPALCAKAIERYRIAVDNAAPWAC
jgi:pyruvate dehydrogenase E1 component